MTHKLKAEWLLFTLNPLEVQLVENELKSSCSALDAMSIKELDIKLQVYQYAYQVSFSVDDGCHEESLLSAVESASQTLKFDYCRLLSVKPIKLAVFDMDSTLIPMEVIDELACEAGVKLQVSEITEAAMRGELDFNQSFEQRLSLLKGMSEQAVEAVKSRLSFNPGVEAFINYLSEQGATVAIASGGFVPFAEALCSKAPITKIAANQLMFNQGQLTGAAVKPIINAEKKAIQLQQWQKELGLENGEVLAVGDGANDSFMLEVAGLGVAYKAKPFLRRRADCVIQQGGMDGMIDILKGLDQAVS